MKTGICRDDFAKLLIVKIMDLQEEKKQCIHDLKKRKSRSDVGEMGKHEGNCGLPV